MTTNVATKAQWLALADRCEKAMEPDWQLDIDIFEACGWQLIGIEDDEMWTRAYSGRFEATFNVEEFTLSLDAITALIERELPGWDWSTAKSHGHCRANVWRLSPISRGSFPPKHATAATAALALCAAFCSVMAANLEIET